MYGRFTVDAIVDLNLSSFLFASFGDIIPAMSFKVSAVMRHSLPIAAPPPFAFPVASN